MRRQQQQLLSRHTVAANAVQRACLGAPVQNAETVATAAARIQLSRATLVHTYVHSAKARAATISEAIRATVPSSGRMACNLALRSLPITHHSE
jgi:hypothetical protein